MAFRGRQKIYILRYTVRFLSERNTKPSMEQFYFLFHLLPVLFAFTMFAGYSTLRGRCVFSQCSIFSHNLFLICSPALIICFYKTHFAILNLLWYYLSRNSGMLLWFYRSLINVTYYWSEPKQDFNRITNIAGLLQLFISRPLFVSFV